MVKQGIHTYGKKWGLQDTTVQAHITNTYGMKNFMKHCFQLQCITTENKIKREHGDSYH